MLVQLMRTHPLIWLKGQIVRNPLYTEPAEILAEIGRSADPSGGSDA